MDIAFCINRLGLIGLGVTITSLIRNCSDNHKLNIWFLCVNFSDREKSSIIRLLEAENFSGRYGFIDFEPFETFRCFASLHGDWTTYGRLLLADYLHAEQVLYLDYDLVVGLDVLQVDAFDFQGNALAAVGGGKFEHALGRDFYIGKLGVSPEVEYFNAGVLLINLYEWRLNNLKEECLKIAKKYPLELPSHDQSLMNLICLGNFAKLPQTFNCGWSADMSKPSIADKMIIHFIGSPKPWDPLGSLIHSGYHEWKKYLNNDWAYNYGHITAETVSRVWQIRRSYIRCIRNKMIQ